MEPEEKWTPRILLQPRQCPVHAFSCAPIHEPKIAIDKFLRRKRIVVEIEPARQSPTSVEHKCTDHGTGNIPALFKRLRYRSKSRIKRLPCEILDTILKRIQACKNDRVRGPRQRYL